MNTLKVFTAFSGYDSQCMALDRLGIDYSLVGWSEIDKYAIQAHNAVYPQYAERNYGDICKINWDDVPYFELFTYSFPCTDISSAGKQEGLTEGSGTRSSLLWECRKAIEIKRPKYLLMENVKALTSAKFMPYLLKWLHFLEYMGYSNYTKVLNAKDYGVPQNRERVFVVSILGDERYSFPKPFKLEKRLKDVLESNVDEKYYLSKKMVQCFVNRTEIAKKKGNGFKFKPTNGDGIAKAITTCAGNRTDDNFVYSNKRLNEMIDKNIIDKSKIQYLDTYNMQVRDDISGTITTRTDSANNTFISEPKFVGYTRDNSGKVLNRHLQEICNTIRCSTGSGGNTDCFVYEPKIEQTGNLLDSKNYKNPMCGRIYSINGISPTLMTMQGGNREPKILNDSFRIRKLTPRECFRLMGVSENDIDKIQNAGISNTQQYKMAGNSIVVNVLCHIFRKLFIDKEQESIQLTLF